jgi:hypothetical protein
MKTANMPLAALVGLWVAQLVFSTDAVAADKISPLPHERIGLLELKTVKEPSGICYHSKRKTLFVVDDGGVVCEFRPDGGIVKQTQVRPADFEGITHDPLTGLLYIAVEGAESILEVDPDTLQVKREFSIPRTFQGKTVMKEGGQGIEAITFVPDRNHPHGGTFFVANQSFDLGAAEDISAVFEIEAPLRGRGSRPGSVKILRYFKAAVVDVSGLHYDAKRDVLYAISDATDRIMAYTRGGELLRAWSLPGENQEGITVDPDGIMYIAQDSGGVLKLKIDWRKMRQRE